MNFRSSNPLANIPVVTKNLLIVTVISFLAQKGLPALGFDYTNFFALHYWKSDLFYPHQLVTHIFMHSMADFSHLLFNMFGLYMFGRVLESTMGEKKFLIFYLITGIGAALVQLISREVQAQLLIGDLSNEAIEYAKMNGAEIMRTSMGNARFLNDSNFVKYLLLTNSTMVGASGAIFGILMAFGYLFPNAQLQLLFPPIPIKGKYIAILALVIGIATDLQGNVAHFAHFGGILTAFILLKIWNTKGNSFRI